MGIYDRDYYRTPQRRGGFGNFNMGSITTWLIAINVVVFLFDQASGGVLTDWGYFSIVTAVFGLQVWRFITFQFLHHGIEHIFFNMMALYFFGPIIESYLGRARYLAFYLLSGIGGALGYILLTYMGFLPGGGVVPLVGASAGIFGILIAAARIAPNAQVILLVFPMQLRQMAWLLVGIAAYTVIFAGHNAGGEAAHLGGAVVGFVLIQNEQWLNFAHLRRPRMKYRGKPPEFKDWRNDMNR